MLLYVYLMVFVLLCVGVVDVVLYMIVDIVI